MDIFDTVNLSDMLLIGLFDTNDRFDASADLKLEQVLKGTQGILPDCYRHFSLIPLVESGLWFCLVAFHCCDGLVFRVFRATLL